MIRAFRPEDLESVCDIATRAWAPIFESYRKLIGDALFEQSRPDWRISKRNQLTNFAAKAPERILINEFEGRVIAFLTYSLNTANKIGIIDNNAVDPDFRGRGAGQALYAAAFAEFKKAGMTAAQVTTGLDEGHAPARRAYERAGFKENLPSVTYYKKL